MGKTAKSEEALRSALMTMSIAAGVLEKDGDEHGVAWNLRNEIAQRRRALGIVEDSSAVQPAALPGLGAVFCPGCGEGVPLKNVGCPHCGYENNDDGRLLTIAEILNRPSYPAAGALRLNDVCPAFLRAVVAAASRR